MVGSPWIFAEWMSQWFLRSHDNYAPHPNILTPEKWWLLLLAPTPNTWMNIPEFFWSGKSESSLFHSIQTFGILMLQIFFPKCQLLFYFFILLSQQAYKYFQWNFTKWHILHFVNQIYTNYSLTPLSSSVSGLNAFAFLTLDSSFKYPVFKLYPGQVIPEFKGRLRGKWGRIGPHPARVGPSVWRSLKWWPHQPRPYQAHSKSPLLPWLPLCLAGDRRR